MIVDLETVESLEFNGTGFTMPGSCVSCTKYDENSNIVVLTIQHHDVEDDLNEEFFGWQEPMIAIRKRKDLGLV